MTTATAQAHPNIALIKYWGKSDEALSLPATGSLSLTLDIFPTTTTVAVDPALPADVFELNGAVRDDDAARRVTVFLDLVRALAGSRAPAHVRSTNTVPTGAGLASSAAGFAALAVAAAAAYGLELDAPALSRLARRGSGSASRSIVPNVALWTEGDDATSFAREVPAPTMAMVVVTLDAGVKHVSSRVAMRRTIETSPFFPAWVTSTRASLAEMVAACATGDFPRIGELTEANALRMHATMQGAEPAIRYLSPASIALFDRVVALRAEGVAAYATADAGPNVAVICPPADAERVAAALRATAASLPGVSAEVLVAGPGPGAHLLAPAASATSPRGVVA